jgi:hypothetical protein
MQFWEGFILGGAFVVIAECIFFAWIWVGSTDLTKGNTIHDEF